MHRAAATSDLGTAEADGFCSAAAATREVSHLGVLWCCSVWATGIFYHKAQFALCLLRPCAIWIYGQIQSSTTFQYFDLGSAGI